MNRQHQLWSLVCALALVNVFDVPISIASSTQWVSNPQRGLAMSKWDGQRPFTLNLAVFKNRSNAVSYQKQVARYISAPVYISYMSGSDLYAVVVGPIKNLDRLHTTSRQVLNVPSGSKQKAEKNNKQTPFGWLPLERKKNVTTGSPNHQSLKSPEASSDKQPLLGFLSSERKKKDAAVPTKRLSRGLVTENRSNHQFTLNLAVFKNRNDALAYQKQASKYISAPVYVSYLSQSDRYAVVVGPIKSLGLLHTTRRQALKTPVAPSDLGKSQVAWPELGQNSWVTHQQSSKSTVSTTKKYLRPLGHRNIPVEPLKRTLTTIQPGPYVGMTTGPVINASGSPATYGGWQGAAFAGLGGYISQQYPWLYLGAEITGLNSGRFAYARVPLAPSVQSGWSYSFDAIPGVLINDHTMAYVRIGGIQTHFLHTVNTIGRQGRAISLPGRNEAGWEFGVGMQAKWFRHIEARLEYVFDDYIDERHALPGRLKIYGNRVGAGLVYKFYDEPEMKK